MNNKITKKELRKIFRKHNLELGFPINADNGSVVVDWDYKFNRVSWEDSSIRKFQFIMGFNREYRTKYEMFDFAQSHKVSLKRVKN